MRSSPLRRLARSAPPRSQLPSSIDEVPVHRHMQVEMREILRSPVVLDDVELTPVGELPGLDARAALRASLVRGVPLDVVADEEAAAPRTQRRADERQEVVEPLLGHVR